MFPPVLTTKGVGTGLHALGQGMNHPGHSGRALDFRRRVLARAHWPFATGLLGRLVPILADQIITMSFPKVPASSFSRP